VRDYSTAWIFSRRNVTGFAVTLVVTYSETDSVKFNDASVHMHTIFFVIENQDASEQRALEGNQTSSGTK